VAQWVLGTVELVVGDVVEADAFDVVVESFDDEAFVEPELQAVAPKMKRAETAIPAAIVLMGKG